MSNLGFEENVFEIPPRFEGEPAGENMPVNDTHFATQNGTHPEEKVVGVPYRDKSGKPAKTPPNPQVME
ncbi:hypothetical protein AUJ77_00860 [Candidatus Nomurabacteria bacterium CG1_02_43_90]|uniref:Uncharacterized protein n=1 Tax=Candidatus Nomurabacteria bacterium CG1_02_43_90 TaxID=1805281 RepID=A0A1J4V1J2_9BACT|nr:MAG: hypothetical protein AUJ77_00860 [Candidatus Nomurabacteria bacterium CG1_02_43_90]